MTIKFCLRLLMALSASFFLAACGGFGGGGGGGGKNVTKPATGLTATAGNAEITLNWDAYAGANGYAVLRSMTSGGPFSYIDLSGTVITGTTFTDPGLTNGTTYYYQVVASTPATFSNPSNVASATPSGPSKNIAVTVDLLANVHVISHLIYGGAFPQRLPAALTPPSVGFIPDLFAVRWGGNASSTYNWQLGTANAASDNFFENFTFCGVGGTPTNSPCSDTDSVQFLRDVVASDTFPIMTMPMLPWVAQSPARNGNGHYSFSVARDGAQCHTDSQNPDAGDGIALSSNCDAQPNFLTASSSDINAAYVPLLDDHSQACPSANCVYRSDWAAALASAFDSSNLPAPHFYEMDNEMDMWGVTHRDIHPSPSSYDEMANVYLTEATKLKSWDPKAVRLGPLSCCWGQYWNGANSNDKAAHAGDDFLPWWLNQIYWHDQISGARSLDVFDIHAFPDATTTDSNGNPLPKSQLQALTSSIFRDYWDPTFVSPSTTIKSNVTSIQPNPTIPFRIPRMRALVNTIYPGTPLAISEWRASFAGESDFSTVLADVDAYGIMGRENVYVASRWTAPNPANPNYWALRLYTNYDPFSFAQFGLLSVSATHNGDPNLFSSYASVGVGGDTPKIIVINKDPQNSVQAQLTLKGFNPTSFTTYTLAAPYPVGIASSSSQPWSSVLYFPPYSATLVVVSGSFTGNYGGSSVLLISPDSMMVPAGGTGTLSYTGGNPTSVAFDAYEGAPACAGTIALTGTNQITVNAGSTPGFCHFTLSNGTSTQGGWIIVGNPAASLTIAGGNSQTAARGTTLPIALSVNLAPGNSGGANPASGASILFSTNAGTLSNGTASGSKIIAITNSSGVASVALTLPATAQAVKITAEGPYDLGHPTAAFTETSQ